MLHVGMIGTSMQDMWAMSADNTCGMFTFHVSCTVCKVTNIERLRLSCTCICVRGLQSQASAPLVTEYGTLLEILG